MCNSVTVQNWQKLMLHVVLVKKKVESAKGQWSDGVFIVSLFMDS